MSVNKTDTGRWRVRVYHRGKQVATATFDRKKDADKWELDHKAALASGAWTDPRNGNITLDEVIAEFLRRRRGSVAQHTFTTDEANLRLHVPASMRRLPIGIITKKVLKDWVADLLEVRSRNTVKRIRESLSAVFAYALDSEYIARNLVAEAPLPRGDGTQEDATRPFTTESFDRLLIAIQEINPVYADIVEFLRETGLRWGGK